MPTWRCQKVVRASGGPPCIWQVGIRRCQAQGRFWKPRARTCAGAYAPCTVRCCAPRIPAPRPYAAARMERAHSRGPPVHPPSRPFVRRGARAPQRNFGRISFAPSTELFIVRFLRRCVARPAVSALLPPPRGSEPAAYETAARATTHLRRAPPPPSPPCIASIARRQRHRQPVFFCGFAEPRRTKRALLPARVAPPVQRRHSRKRATATGLLEPLDIGQLVVLVQRRARSGAPRTPVKPAGGASANLCGLHAPPAASTPL